MELNLHSNTLASNANFYDIRGGRPQAQAEPVSVPPLNNAADLSASPSAKNLQAHYSIRSGETGLNRGMFDHLSQAAKLDAIEAALRNYETLNAEEKTKVIAAAAQFINSVKIDIKNYEKVTLFIGQTGAGKSTLINYLAGAEIKGKWNEELKSVSLDIPNMLKDISVGHGASSCTFAPMPYEDEANGLVYFDCPGFMDSRGILHEIIAAKLIQDVIRNAEKVNFVITVTESCLSDRGHIRVLKETIDVLETYAPDFEASKNSMLLVVTKGANNKNFGEPGEEIHDIGFFNAKVGGKAGILVELDKELSDYQRKFLRFINDAKRFTYSFKADIEIDESVSTVERERIIDRIKNLQPVPTQEVAGIKVSDHAKLRSIELAQHIQAHLQELNRRIVKIASKGIESFCSKAVEELEDLFNQDSTVLKSILENFQRKVMSFAIQEHDTAKVFFENLQILLKAHEIDIEESSLQEINTILADIQNNESAQLLFSKICSFGIESSNIKNIFLDEVLILSQALKSLIQSCTCLECFQPIKPGFPYLEKLEDEEANTTKVNNYLKHAQEHEASRYFKDAEEDYSKALRYTEDAEHYKLYVACLKEIYISDENQKAYQEKASRAFYYLGELYAKKSAWKEAQAAYKASSELALHEAPLHALLDVARQLKEDIEIADALERMASFYMKKGKIALAIDKLEEAFEVTQSVHILQKLEALYGQEAAENSRLKVYETRIRLFELQISQAPKNIELYRDYGWFLKSIGRHNEARIVKKRLDKLFQTVQQKVIKQKNKIVEQTLTIQDLKQKINLQAGEIDDLQEKVEAFEKHKLPEQAKRLNTLNEQVEFLGGQVILLDFSNRSSIKDTDLIPLLNKNPYIKSLNLQGCEHLTDAVLHILPERFENLQELNLTGCKQIKEAGLDAIAERASKLKCLILDYCPGITIKVLHKLNKKCIAFSIEGVSFKANKLDLSNRKATLTDDELRQALEANPEITELNLYNCKKITDAGLVPLKGFQWLEKLNLQYCEITDEGLERLSSFIHLKELNLADCPNITGTGFVHIKNFKKLVSLRLDYCKKLTDTGFIHLKRLSLSQLTLNNCPSLKGETLAYLKGTPWCKQSISLNFSGCEKLTDDALAQLNYFPKLTSLNLNSCSSLTDNGFTHLSNLKGLKSLSIQSCNNLTDNGLRYISELIQLNSLDLYSCSKLTGSGFSYARNLKELQSLSLTSCSSITDNNLNYLSRLPKLNSLNLGYCHALTGSGFSYLSNLKELKSLQFNNCNNITDDAFKHLAGLQQLTSLNFNYCNKLTGSGFVHLKDLHWCKEATSLTLERLENLLDGSIQHLGHFKKLRDLTLYETRSLTGACFQHLRTIPTLTSLKLINWSDVSDTMVQQLTQQLSNLKQVTSLNLGYCKSLSNEGLKSLATLTQLKSLTLDFYNSQPIVTGAGFACLSALNALEKLEIRYAKHLTDEDAAYFKNLKQLKSITFYSCDNISDKIKNYLRDQLKVNIS